MFCEIFISLYFYKNVEIFFLYEDFFLIIFNFGVEIFLIATLGRMVLVFFCVLGFF